MKKHLILSVLLTSFAGHAQTPDPFTIGLNWDAGVKSGQITLEEALRVSDSLFATTGDSIYYIKKEYNRDMVFLLDRFGGDPGDPTHNNDYAKALRSIGSISTLCNGTEGNWYSVGPVASDLNEMSLGWVNAVWSDPAFPNKIIIGSNTSGIWMTNDGGVTWANKTDDLGIPLFGVQHIVQSPTDPNKFYAGAGRKSHSGDVGLGVLISDDAGETWYVNIDLLSIDPYLKINMVRTHPTDGNVVIACGDNGVYYSSNAGASWISVPIPIDFRPHSIFTDIVILENNRVFLCTDNKFDHMTQIWYSDDITNGIWNDAFPIMTFHYPSIRYSHFASGPYGFSEDSEWNWHALTNTFRCSPSGVNSTFTSIKTDFDVFPDPLDPALYQCEFDVDIPAGCEFRLYVSDSDIFGSPGSTEILVYSSGFVSTATSVSPLINIGNVPFNMESMVIQLETDGSYSSGDLILDNLHFGSSYGISACKFAEPFDNNFSFLVGNNTESIAPANVMRNLCYSDDYGITFNSIRANINITLWQKIEIEQSRQNPLVWYFGDCGLKKAQHPGIYSNITSQSCGAIETNWHTDIRSMLVRTNPATGEDILLIGNDGGVTLSTDGGGSFQALNGAGLSLADIYGFGVAQSTDIKIVSGHQDNNSFVYDGGLFNRTWQGDGSQAGVNPTYYEEYFLSEGQSGTVRLYKDGLYTTISKGGLYVGILDFDVKADWKNRRIYRGFRYNDDFPASEGVVKCYNIDSGTDNAYQVPGSQGIGSIGITENNSNIIYAAEYNSFDWTTNVFYKSIDGGSTWLDLSSSTVNYIDANGSPSTLELRQILYYKDITDIFVSPNNDQELWVTIPGLIYENGDLVDEQWRVLHSTDGGLSWSDYSEGLPGFPVFDIIRVKGTNDLLFIGTDVGVYYRDASMSQWECFSTGLPPATITDLDINYCTNELYCSTFGRGIHATPIDFYTAITRELPKLKPGQEMNIYSGIW